MRPREVELALVGDHVPGLPTTVLGDHDRLTQLLVILIDNAIDHSPLGSTVSVSVRAVDRRVELSVIDQGPGVPAIDRERVFEPFIRLPGLRRDRTSGTGLGLSIAQRIVAAHRGEIAVGDADGGGARFVVSLPAAEG